MPSNGVQRNGAGKKMNIMFVHANNDDIGGADYCLFKLVYELSRDQFNPIVVLSRKTKILDLYREHNIPVEILDMMRVQKGRGIGYLARLVMRLLPTLLQLRDLIRTKDIQLVFSNDLLDIYGGMAAKLSGVRSAQYIRMILPGGSLTKWLLTRLSLMFNDRILVVSKAVSRYMFPVKFAGGLHKKVRVCHDWIDMKLVGHTVESRDIRYELGLDSKVIISSVSRLEPWKGQRVLVESAAKLLDKHKNAAFLIVGGAVQGRNRENYGTELRELARELGIADSVHFLGERQDVNAILQRSDIFVHSPISPDPFPGVVLEAMASSKIVIGADDGGIPEEMEDQVTGFLFRPGDAEDLYDRLNYLLENRHKIEEMGKNGYKRVTQHFAKEKIFPQVKQCLIEVLEEKS